MSRLTHDHLVAIERHADTAPVQQLRLQVMQIRDDLRHLVDDDADYAHALLLKLGRIVDEQLAPRAAAQAVQTWIADWQPPTWLSSSIHVPGTPFSAAPRASVIRKRVGRRRSAAGPGLPQRAAGAGNA